MKNPYFIKRKFDCIVSNYPFSINWDPEESIIFNEVGIIPTKGKADYAFILHILYMLSNTGIAITLNFPGILYRGGREGKIRKWIIEKNYIDKIIMIGGGNFIDTNIDTVIIVFNKNKKNTDIEFTNIEGESKIVIIEDIIKNDYILSVNNYIIKEEKKEIINPKKLMEKSRRGFIKKLKADLTFDKQVCNIEGWDFNEYINIIEKELQLFKK